MLWVYILYCKLRNLQGGAEQWQNAQFVERQLIMEIMSAILIENHLECGSLTSDVLVVK